MLLFIRMRMCYIPVMTRVDPAELIKPTVIELNGPMEVGELSLRLSRYDLREVIVFAYPDTTQEPIEQTETLNERYRKLASGLLIFDCELDIIKVGDPPAIAHATPKEGVIFERLTRQENTLVSREFLHQLINGGTGNDHTVDIHISNLRAKLGPARNYIRNKRGFGFYTDSRAKIEID